MKYTNIYDHIPIHIYISERSRKEDSMNRDSADRKRKMFE